MPTNPNAPKQRVQVFIDRDLADRIRRAARDDERTQSVTIRRLIRKALAEEEKTA